MFNKLVYISFLFLISSFVQLSSVKAMEDIDPEKIKTTPVQTKNGKGANFNSLGSFEEEFIKDCRGLEVSEGLETGNILLVGEAYGRLSMHVLRETPSGLSNIFVNELSNDNLQHLDKKIALLKESKKIQEVQSASRMSLIVGDCLDLPSNERFTQLLSSKDISNCFDLIMCSNVLHFFDGEQVLKFFVNTFNFLKPCGKAYIFTQSRTVDFTKQELMDSQRLSYIGMKAYFGVMDAAKKNSDTLFPGLIHDDWLRKAPVLTHIFSTKPNGLCLVNYIPETTLQFIAHMLGFEVVFQKFYTTSGTQGSVKMSENPNGEYLGLILKKPNGYAGGQVTMETLDSDFVQACRTAKKDMKTFIDTKLNFPLGYPFVEMKK